MLGGHSLDARQDRSLGLFQTLQISRKHVTILGKDRCRPVPLGGFRLERLLLKKLDLVVQITLHMHDSRHRWVADFAGDAADVGELQFESLSALHQLREFRFLGGVEIRLFLREHTREPDLVLSLSDLVLLLNLHQPERFILLDEVVFSRGGNVGRLGHRIADALIVVLQFALKLVDVSLRRSILSSRSLC